MIRPAALGLLATVAFASNACGSTCDLTDFPNLIVHVRADNMDACDAIVELLDKGGKLIAEVPRGGGCAAVGQFTGQFYVRARRGARISDTLVVDLDFGGCGRPSKKAEITLILQM